jgi:hypothetical protein
MTYACPLCKGKFELPDERLNQPLCRRCNGNGRENGILCRLCTTCGGWGRLPPDVTQGTIPKGLLVVYLTAGKPHTAQEELGTVIGTLRGQIRICDPYYGTGTLARLTLLKECQRVLFLTRTPDSKEQSFLSRSLTEFKTEYLNVEFRRYRQNDLHDRFIITDDEMIFLGHGLKDIGGKDSFIVRIPVDLAKDTLDSVRASFDRKWDDAEALA